MTPFARFTRSIAATLAIMVMTLAVQVPLAAAPPEAAVDINVAGAEQLATLPGIGPAIAKRIIDYRQANGPFKRPSELMNVKGIGEKTYLRLKDRITTETEKNR